MTSSAPAGAGITPTVAPPADLRRIVLAPGLRQFAYGLLAAVLAVALTRDGLTPGAIGALITVSLAGDFCGAYLISLRADAWGRRRTLVGLALLMAATGAVFGLVRFYPLLLVAALVFTHLPSNLLLALVALMPTFPLTAATATPVPPATDTPIPTATPTPLPTATATPHPTAVPNKPAVAPTPKPVPPKPTPVPSGVNSNPWGYNFSCCNFIYSPPAVLCAYFPCIRNFPNGKGYVVECRDGMYSKSGGRRGACSDHHGEWRALLAP